MDKKNNLPNCILHHIPWDDHCNPIWPVTSFSLYRNLAKYPFPSKITENQSLELIKLFEKKFSDVSQLQSLHFLLAQDLSSQEKEFLSEHFFCSESWPNSSKGQAFVVDESSLFFAILNIKEHLILQWIDYKDDWENAWNRLNQIEESITDELEIAYSPQFGYHTSDPTCSGTALRISCYLHLPGLIFLQKLPDLLQNYAGNQAIYSGLFGQEGLLADCLVLKNKYTLGLSEEAIAKDLQQIAMRFVLEEKEARIQLQKNPPLELKDQISRAYGLFLHSFQIDTKEALNALSQIKLGIYLGWIKGISDQAINELLFRCRRAHLIKSSEEKDHEQKFLDIRAISQARAEYLHRQLQKTTLQFN